MKHVLSGKESEDYFWSNLARFGPDPSRPEWDECFIVKEETPVNNVKNHVHIGSVAKCSQGKVGLILNRKGDLWKGVKLEETGSWESKNPQILFNNLCEYIDNRISQVLAQCMETTEKCCGS